MLLASPEAKIVKIPGQLAFSWEVVDEEFQEAAALFVLPCLSL